MDRQLEKIARLLDEQGVTYWLDSGTLLGVMREQRLLDHDEDIDIGLWKEDEEALEKTLPAVLEMGYAIHRVSYKGEAFHYLFKPRESEKRLIEFTLYSRAGDHAWCPVFYFKLLSKREGQGPTSNKPLLSLLRKCIRRCWKLTFAKMLKDLEISFFLWRPFIKTGFWWIPIGYFEEIIYDERAQAYRPYDYNGYLTYRYGDWRKPNRDWVFYRDDRGIQHIELDQNPQDFRAFERQ